MTATALYLYCVVPASSTKPEISSAALDGGRVHAVRHQDLAALAHPCTPEPYQGSEAEVRNWIAAHNAVVEEAWKSAGTVLPMTFDVIIRGDGARSAEANVVGWLEQHRGDLRIGLEALMGRTEAGVQILWDAARLAAAEADGPDAAQARPRGRAYFARQQHRREHREGLVLEAEADFRRHSEILSALVDDVRINRPQPVKGKRMVLNLSLLADQTGLRRVGDYLEWVNREPGLEVRFTGPWPPYSFASIFGNLNEGTGLGVQSPECGQKD